MVSIYEAASAWNSWVSPGKWRPRDTRRSYEIGSLYKWAYILCRRLQVSAFLFAMVLRFKSSHFCPQHYASDTITEINFVPCEVGTEFFNTVNNNYGLQMVKVFITIIRTGLRISAGTLKFFDNTWSQVTSVPFTTLHFQWSQSELFSRRCQRLSPYSVNR